MERDDERVIEAFVRLLNAEGRPVAERLLELLSDPENDEAAGWLDVNL